MLNTQLNHWLQPQHLQSENLAQYRQAFLDHEAGVLQIDDFLKTDLLQKASQFLHHQGQYTPSRGLYKKQKGGVSTADWENATEKERFYIMEKLNTEIAYDPTNENFQTYQQLTKLFISEAFETYLTRLTGIPSLATWSYTPHKMTSGHYMKRHSDRNGANRLSVLVYMSPGWQPDYGGALRVETKAGQEFVVENRFNRFVVIDLHRHHKHAVQLVTDLAGPNARIALGVTATHKKT